MQKIVIVVLFAWLVVADLGYAADSQPGAKILRDGQIISFKTVKEAIGSLQDFDQLLLERTEYTTYGEKLKAEDAPWFQKPYKDTKVCGGSKSFDQIAKIKATGVVIRPDGGQFGVPTFESEKTYKCQPASCFDGASGGCPKSERHKTIRFDVRGVKVIFKDIKFTDGVEFVTNQDSYVIPFGYDKVGIVGPGRVIDYRAFEEKNKATLTEFHQFTRSTVNKYQVPPTEKSGKSPEEILQIRAVAVPVLQSAVNTFEQYFDGPMQIRKVDGWPDFHPAQYRGFDTSFEDWLALSMPSFLHIFDRWGIKFSPGYGHDPGPHFARAQTALALALPLTAIYHAMQGWRSLEPTALLRAREIIQSAVKRSDVVIGLTSDPSTFAEKIKGDSHAGFILQEYRGLVRAYTTVDRTDTLLVLTTKSTLRQQFPGLIFIDGKQDRTIHLEALNYSDQKRSRNSDTLYEIEVNDVCIDPRKKQEYDAAVAARGAQLSGGFDAAAAAFGGAQERLSSVSKQLAESASSVKHNVDRGQNLTIYRTEIEQQRGAIRGQHSAATDSKLAEIRNMGKPSVANMAQILNAGPAYYKYYCTVKKSVRGDVRSGYGEFAVRTTILEGNKPVTVSNDESIKFSWSEEVDAKKSYIEGTLAGQKPIGGWVDSVSQQVIPFVTNYIDQALVPGLKQDLMTAADSNNAAKAAEAILMAALLGIELDVKARAVLDDVFGDPFADSLVGRGVQFGAPTQEF